MAQSRAGTLYLRIDGVQYDLSGSLKISPHDIERESLVGLDGVHGFMVKHITPFIEGEFLRNPGLGIQTLQNITNSTVTAEFDDGTTYVLRNAWLAKPPELEASDGKYNLRFEGLSMQELGASL